MIPLSINNPTRKARDLPGERVFFVFLQKAAESAHNFIRVVFRNPAPLFPAAVPPSRFPRPVVGRFGAYPLNALKRQ